ncbi:MAG: carboxysome shell carbonic anhydrase, partial [Actinomycetes bacterium]
MKSSLLQPDGRSLAPWEQAPVWAGAGARATVTSPPVHAARNGGFAFKVPAGGHPLAEPALSAALRQRAEEIAAAFARIEPVLRRLAPRQFDDGFPQQAHRELADSLGVDIPAAELESSWSTPLDLGRVHARCVLGTFGNLVEREFDRNLARLLDEGESNEVLIRRFGFHAVDITACADGRLAGAVDFILRVPPAVVAWRDAYAGAMFDVEGALHRWEAVELRRWREGRPNDASEPTRYLKIGLYHFSSVDPHHQGCAAFGSDEERAARGLLARLQEFAGAVESTQCCEAKVDTLLVGVDTDTDAIRVHVPDAAGATDVDRFVSSA